MNTAHLPHRSILSLSGAGAANLLQGATTQEVEKNKTAPALYAAHLSPQGKFLFDFLIYPQTDGTFWLDCHKSQLMDLAKALHAYAVGLEVEFEDLNTNYKIYAQWGESNFDKSSLADPRLPALGHRLILPAAEAVETNATEEDYTTHRLALGTPDGAVDATPNKTLPAELGLEFLNGVSFTKGCYVGQEVTARMHHRTTPKKRLYKVKLKGETPRPAGTPIMADAAEAGTLFSNNGKIGMAIIRERYINKPLTVEGSLCTPSLASYWPN